MGVHPFRDPALTDDFAAPRLPIDVADFHVYAADWRPGRVDFSIDGEHVRTVHQAPAYPKQMRGVRLSDEGGRHAGTPRAAARRGQRPRGDLALTRLSRS